MRENRRFLVRRLWLDEHTQLLGGNRGAQIVEFAVSLPLLMVLIVGIFDFGAAFTLKQKLATAALDGVRVAYNQPTSDLSISSTPPSINVIADVVAGALERSNGNDCGLLSARTVSPGPGALTWSYSASTGCPGVLTLKIERGHTYHTSLTSPFPSDYTIEATRITLTYPYKWQFDKVIKVMIPGASYAGTSQITSVAVMQNLN